MKRRDKVSIGYACLTVGVPNTNMRTCRQDNATEDRLGELIAHNLNSLENIIDYNIKNNIKLFRISSDIIPFGSSPVNSLPWWELFEEELRAIGAKIENSKMRVSMHPGQYTVLNSPREDVVERAILDLKYHTKLLRSLGAGPKSKIILHIGGVYGEKAEAMERFMTTYDQLDADVKQHLVIENDDRSYTIEDVLGIGEQKGIPVVFDNLHHAINKCDHEHNDLYWVRRCRETWKACDGKQKIHYSQQDPLKKPGGHSETTKINEFLDYYQEIEGQDIDIMLEVKDKNLSALKCINTLSQDKRINKLEKEWGKYKYTILENSPPSYGAIRNLLKDKKSYPGAAFYSLIEEGLEREQTIGNSVNAAHHVWGYFKKTATDGEKSKVLQAIEEHEQGKAPISKAKKILWKLAVKYNEAYLLDSYYFVL